LNSFTDLYEQWTEAEWSPVPDAEGDYRLAIVSGTDVEIWENAWNPSTVTRTLTYQYYADYNPPAVNLIGVEEIEWSPDAAHLAVAFSPTDIVNVATGTRERRIRGEWLTPYEMRWYPDGRLALGTIDRSVNIVDPTSGELINFFLSVLSIASIPPGIISIDFSPDGNQIVMGTEEGRIMVWGDTRTTDIMTEIPSLVLAQGSLSQTVRVWTVDWNPTQNYIASGAEDGVVRIWDATTGEQLEQIDLGEGVHVNSVAWSPDGSKLAYGNPDGSVTLFDATQLPGYTPMATAEAE
jgi:WD40 repeat protein